MGDSEDIEEVRVKVLDPHSPPHARNLLLEVNELLESGAGQVLDIAEVEHELRPMLLGRLVRQRIQILRSKNGAGRFDDNDVTSVVSGEPEQMTAIRTGGVTRRVGRFNLDRCTADGATVGSPLRRPGRDDHDSLC